MTSLGHLQPYNNGGNIESDPEGHVTLSQKIEAFLDTVNAQQNYLNERGKVKNSTCNKFIMPTYFEDATSVSKSWLNLYRIIDGVKHTLVLFIQHAISMYFNFYFQLLQGQHLSWKDLKGLQQPIT